jgi:tetratricopeptide (TPR) repeat protein
MEDRAGIDALIGDLHWQIDQLEPRGVKNNAGQPYSPAYYKRGLQKAIDRGGLAVADYVRGYLYKPPSDGFKKLEDADSIDLACEALVAEESKPYAHLFSDADRAAARARLAPHIEAIAARKAASQARIDARLSKLPTDVDELRELAAGAVSAEDAIAINTAILRQAPDDPVAMNRLGRAYEALGQLDAAKEVLRQAVELDPQNAIAKRRLRDLDRRQRR